MVLCLGEEHEPHFFLSLVPCHGGEEHGEERHGYHEDEEAEETHSHGEEHEHDCPCPDDCSADGSCIDIFISVDGDRHEPDIPLPLPTAVAVLSGAHLVAQPALHDGGLRDLPAPCSAGPPLIQQTQRLTL